MAITTSRDRYSTKPFAEALSDLLREEARGTDTKPNLTAFLRRVPGWRVDTLRKQVLAERTLQPAAVEAMAEVLNIAPEYFVEYRTNQISEAVTLHPELVDLVYDLLVSRAQSLEAMVIPMVTTAVDRLASGEDIDDVLAARVLELIMNGQVSDVQAASFLTALRTKGETAEEIAGLTQAMLNYALLVDLPPNIDALDVVSTGGDRLSTFNISTTSAFVAAGAGVTIAKHGNRGQTSKAGAAELVQELGARIDLPPQAVTECVLEVGFGFMYAPLHYRATRNVIPLRRSLGIRTIFNFLGPLLNPARVKRQLTGVNEARYVPVLAEALAKLGSSQAMLVHGHEGLDEMSISGETLVVEIKDGSCSAPFVVTPEMYGLPRHPLHEIVGGSPVRNAEITRRVLTGTPGAPLDVVLLNAGAAIYLARKTDTIAEGVELARESVSSGRAWDKMAAFVDFTRSWQTETDASPADRAVHNRLRPLSGRTAEVWGPGGAARRPAASPACRVW